MAEPRIIEATVMLPEDSVEIVRQRAQRVGTTMSEIVRRAISNDKFFHDLQDEGSLILIKAPNEKMTQVRLR